MSAKGATPCQIGALDVVPERNVIASGSREFTLEPRIMDVLCELARKPGEVLSRTELIDRVWGVQFGGDESLSRAVSQLRKTFKAAGLSDDYIETIPKRGYRLLQPAKGFDEGPREGDIEPASLSADLTEEIAINDPIGGSSYSVAVIPLSSSEGSDEKFASDDIGRDLIAMMSNAPGLSVAAYDPGLAARSRDVDFRQTSTDLAVHYIVTGSLVRRGDKTNLRVSLLDGPANRHLFSWKFSDNAEDMDDKLDDYVLDLSTSIINEIQIAEAAKAHLRGDQKSDSQTVLRATDAMRAFYSEKRANEIVEHLTDLVHQEPENAVARASLASQLASSVVSQWAKDPMDYIGQAQSHLNVALKLAPNDAEVLVSAGITVGMLNQREDAIRYLNRALEMNPNDPTALASLGLQMGMTGQPERGLELIKTAERRAPHHPRRAQWVYYRATMEWILRDLATCAQSYFEASELNPDWNLPYFSAATAFSIAGEEELAIRCFKKGLAIRPDFTLERFLAGIAYWGTLIPEKEREREIAITSEFWRKHA